MRTAAPKYIRKRRHADPRWVRRNKRSLSSNRQFRVLCRQRHDAAKKLKELLALRESSSLAERIEARLSQFFGRFIPHRAQAR